MLALFCRKLDKEDGWDERLVQCVNPSPGVYLRHYVVNHSSQFPYLAQYVSTNL
jgi:hypothetical protein